MNKLRALSLLALCLPLNVAVTEQLAPVAGSQTPEAPSLLIQSPHDYQVFQRRDRGEGVIAVSGRAPAQADRVEVRSSGESPFGALPEGWCPAPPGEFALSMTLPAGGWYQLHARAYQGDRLVAETTVDHVGVGEVFVGAGQSNSTNSGEKRIQQHSGMVSSFSGEHWQLADDPQPGAADLSQGGSFWPAFGDALYERFGVPIGVAVTGYGGTSVEQWQPGGDLFDHMMTRVRQLGPLGFRAVLWHQGESDVGTESEVYYLKLKNVILASKERAGWEFPWFVAQVSYHNPDNPAFPTTRLAQQRLWDDGVALQGPDTDTLTGDHRDQDGLGIHFSPKGLRVHGQMWAEILEQYVEAVLGGQSSRSLDGARPSG